MSTNTGFSGFTAHKQLVIDLTNDLKQLKAFSEKMKLDGNVQSIDDSLKRLIDDNFSIAIIGEFKRGKSTLINALLEKDVLPTDVLPTTATLNKITYGITPFVTIEYKNGKNEEIDISRLNDYVTKLTKESEKKAMTVKEAVVHYPLNYCKNGVTIIDTPGLNDNAAMTEVTLQVLPQIDAAIMVVMATAPFSESERSFLESKIIASDLGRVLFVVTGIDIVDEDDVEKVLASITTRIQEGIMTKAEKTFGKDSDEYQAYVRKIGKIRVYGLSAKKALKAKLKNDDGMLEQSCFPTFEDALERFLTEDKGAIMFSVPVSRIKSASIELAKAVQLRESSLAMKKEEFDKSYKDAMKLLEDTRAVRQEEFKKLSQTAQETYDELLPSIRNFWSLLEEAAFNTIDDFHIDEDDLSKENQADTQERLLNAISSSVQIAAQNESERIQEKINQAVGKEAERMSAFEEKFSSATEQIQTMFTGNTLEITTEGEYSFAAGTALNYAIPGLGSAYAGYKQAGWKGALLGGGTGMLGTAAGFYGAVSLLATIGLPIALPVVIIGGIVGALIGTKVGAGIVSMFFGGGSSESEESKIEKVKDAVKESISKELEKSKQQDDYDERVHAQIESSFEALKEKYNTESERIMEDIQNQLTQLKIDKAKDTVMGDTEKAELAEMMKKIDAICTHANEVEKQITTVLTREV